MIHKPAIFAAAFLLDILLGDPEYPLHPVRLIGKTIYWTERVIYPFGPGYLGGLLLFFLVSSFWTFLGILMAPYWWAHLFFLYSFLAEGQLIREVVKVASALSEGDVGRARQLLSMLMTRDTCGFDEVECSRCALETLAENTSDGFFGPALAYMVGGLPLLMLYKTVETGDSMVGYKTDRYRKFGFFFAKADDLLNFVPSRLCSLFVALTALVFAKNPLEILRETAKYAPLHESPNAGWPESAFAVLLGIRFGGFYTYFGERVFKKPIGEDKVYLSEAVVFQGVFVSLCSCVMLNLLYTVFFQLIP